MFWVHSWTCGTQILIYVVLISNIFKTFPKFLSFFLWNLLINKYNVQCPNIWEFFQRYFHWWFIIFHSKTFIWFIYIFHISLLRDLYNKEWRWLAITAVDTSEATWREGNWDLSNTYKNNNILHSMLTYYAYVNFLNLWHIAK